MIVPQPHAHKPHPAFGARDEQSMDYGGSQVTITSSPLAQPTTIRLSWRRWLVLFAFFLFGMTSFLTDEVSSILTTMLDLLELKLDKYIYISLIFGNIPILTTMPTAWFVDRYGIRVTMYVATFLMLIRNGSKALLFNPDLPYWQELKLTYWIISGMASIQVLSIYFCMPLKISENWFSKSERSVAWTVMISTAGIGSSIAAFTYPRIITSVQDVKILFYLNIISAIFVSLIVIICITRSKPEYPPSERMIVSQTAANISYFKAVNKMLKHKDMMLHLVCTSMFRGFTIAVITVLQKILLNSGHDRVFIGNLMSVSSIVSMVALIGLSAFVHKLTNITLVCKLSVTIQAILFAINMVAFLYPTPGWLVMVVSILFQISSSWSSPNINNMNAHLASGVVSEATVAGCTTTLIIVAISICKVIFVVLIKEEPGDKSNYTYSTYFTIIVSSLFVLMYAAFFGGKKLENKEEEERAGSSN